MSTAIPLGEQIVAVLTGTCTAAAAIVLAAAELRHGEIGAEAHAADVASLSPLATNAEASAHRSRAFDLRFEADRMDASVSALRARHGELRDAEAEAKRDSERAAVVKARDALAAEIATEYPAIVGRLADLVKRIIANGLECAKWRIDSAEAVGRGLPGSFYMHSVPMIRIQDRAPALPVRGRLAWESTMEGWRFHAPDVGSGA